jgi:uncharacterized membrane protein YcaP (DUF421 family)
MDATTWNDMFHLSLPILEKIIRPIIVYLFLVIGLRLAGKRELAQLNAFDLIVLMMLSNTVQNAIIGDDNSVSGGMLGGAALLAVNYIVVRYMSRHSRLEHLAEGREDLLMSNGRVDRKRLERELISIDDLEMAARKQGFASLAEIDRAVLEPNGSIAFIGMKPSLDDRQHQELVARLDRIEAQLAAIAARG